MKTILVITDFSKASRSAAIYAAELAKLIKAKLLLYHIETILEKANVVQEPSRKENESKRHLEAESIFLTKLNGIIVECLTPNGLSITEISDLEVKGKIDIVIIGIEAPKSFDDFVFNGDVSELIKQTQIPVFIIPENSSFKKIERIAFAIDYQLENELKMHKSIETILDLFKPKIYVLNVVKENAVIRPNKEASEINIEKYFGNNLHIYSFIQNNDVIHGLKDFISGNNIDIITMLPHKYNLLENRFFESKTKQMAFNTDIPLIIFPVGN